MMGGPTLVEAQRKLKECRSALSSWRFGVTRSLLMWPGNYGYLLDVLIYFRGLNVQVIKQVFGVSSVRSTSSWRWKIYAKRHWLQKGDRNTKFYHA